MPALFSTRGVRHKLCMEDLRDLGAKVIDNNGVNTDVIFDIGPTYIAYMYQLTEDSTFILERRAPYAMGIGVFENEEEIVDLITEDIRQFRNAANSNHFLEFVQINSELARLVRIFEDLYLYYNIDSDDIEEIHGSIIDVLRTIKDVEKRSKRAYQAKDPEMLHDIPL